jgi:trigger factor
VKKNLDREVKFRVQARNKAAVMDALAKSAELDLPNSLVANETDRMVEAARADLKQRGVKDAETAPIPAEIFKPQAERRVRLGLVVAELVRTNNLQAKPEQLQAHIEELSQSYEKPSEVVRWYLGNRAAHGRGRGGGHREQRDRIRAGPGQGRGQGATVRRTDGPPLDEIGKMR